MNCAGLPHARGGVSPAQEYAYDRIKSSPRTWGCFHGNLRRVVLRIVFPTHVGVFLKSDTVWKGLVGLPHARGGVSL